MEFIGKTVKKEFKGFGIYTGTVKSYDASSGFFEIEYEDADSEELEYSEVASLLSESGQPELAHEKLRHGRMPRKRRRVEKNGSGSGNVCDNLSGNVNSRDASEETLEKEYRFGGNLIEGIEVDGKLNINVDLNSGFNLNDCNLDENAKRSGGIDLNLDASDDLDENLDGNDWGSSVAKIQKRECEFDLNLGVDHETKDAEGDSEGQSEAEETQKKETRGNVEENATENLTEVPLDVSEGTLMEGVCGSTEHVVGDVCSRLVDVIKNEEKCVDGDSDNAMLREVRVDLKANVSDFQLKDGYEACNTLVDCPVGMVSPSTEGKLRRGRGRGRRKHSGNMKSMTETVLRRSTRRGSAQNHVASPITLFAVNDLSSSPANSAIAEEKPVNMDCERTEELNVLPPKLQLPPSSQNLNLDGIPILDLFSVYSCLRSFSTLLFLSPFELDDFVAALKSKSPTLLFDSIHVSVLQTLRKHLDYLSNEGSKSASNCLRSLNWDLVDLLTWPIFMVEYLLLHGSGLKPGFDLSRLKLFKSDYYKQPESVKIEMLRCLCDDVIEVEAIRSELNRRSLATEPDVDFDHNVSIEVFKKRRTRTDISDGSFLAEETVDDTADWNSDECCLCKMDGNLICCDGCPAAYHSRCVGVASSLLPEGDWYCPECAIDRHKTWTKPRKSLRGAELLGIDPHGRLYYGSSGYLLVSDSVETETMFYHYHWNDLSVIVELLKSADISYTGILKAIYKYWDIPACLNRASGNLEFLNPTISSDIFLKGQAPAICMPLAPLASSEFKDEVNGERKQDENSTNGNTGHFDPEVSNFVKLQNSVIMMESPSICSEGPIETSQMSSVVQNFWPDHSNGSTDLLKQCKIPGKYPTVGDCSLSCNGSDIKLKNNAATGPNLPANGTRKWHSLEVQCGTGYMNHYSFAQTASSVAEEFMHIPSNKANDVFKRSEEDIISAQMKVISKKSTKFYWPNTQNLTVDVQKEKCGWCFSCKVPDDDRECLFNMIMGPVQEVSKSEEVFDLQSEKSKKGHLINVICHILSIEERLHGLLIGSWLNPHHVKLWRRSVLKASDVACLKYLLLSLESNLRRLALSAEWLKPVDSVVVMGSASHVVTNSLSVSSKHVTSRKKARGSYFECNPSSNAASGLVMFWWRGGRLSRQMFNWKRLPRSLVSKGARQAGCARIPGILYPESSDFAKRSKYTAWRAAVETSLSVEQLAFQVRELESNIKWDDIENTHPPSKSDKDSRKSSRLFKKVIIRRKCIEGEVVKYLLDFGKRKIFPDIVVKHGSVLEESSSERKKYWLNELFVPLYLLKKFEEKRNARKSDKMISGKVLEVSTVMKKSAKKRGFSYLFSRAERSEYYQCGHCKKDVLIREAVICQYCSGFFHKRHVRKSAGLISAEGTYTCHRCREGKHMKVDKKKGKFDITGGKIQSQKGNKTTDSRSLRLKSSKKSKGCKKSSTGGWKLQSQDNKKAPVSAPLRRSARIVKYKSQQSKKVGVGKKRKRIKSKKGASKKPKKSTWQKKRTHIFHSYWINGLLLSRKPDDERVMLFREKTQLAPLEHSSVSDGQSKCHLCGEARYQSALNYIACEICGEWYHGDAFGLDQENIDKLIGFRCHICRKRTSPVCPHMPAETDCSQLAEPQNNPPTGSFKEVSNTTPPLTEVQSEQESHLNEDPQALYPTDECVGKEEQLCPVLDSNESSMLESNMEADNGHSSYQKTHAIQNSDDKELKPNILTTSSENLTLEVNTMEVDDDMC